MIDNYRIENLNGLLTRVRDSLRSLGFDNIPAIFDLAKFPQNEQRVEGQRCVAEFLARSGILNEAGGIMLAQNSATKNIIDFLNEVFALPDEQRTSLSKMAESLKPNEETLIEILASCTSIRNLATKTSDPMETSISLTSNDGIKYIVAFKFDKSFDTIKDLSFLEVSNHAGTDAVKRFVPREITNVSDQLKQGLRKIYQLSCEPNSSPELAEWIEEYILKAPSPVSEEEALANSKRLYKERGSAAKGG